MSVSALILGVLNIIIIVVLLLLVGAIAKYVLGRLGWAPGGQVEQLYIALVALIALYMFVALILGMPSISLFGPHRSAF